MTDIIKISVIVPIYNMAEYIPDCLESILGQSLHDIEVICVDDGSKDASVSVIEDYISKDERVKLLIQGNLGPGNARNRGISSASGQYVAVIDADDKYESETVLEKLYNAAQIHGEKICGGNVLNLFENGEKRMGYRPFLTEGHTDYFDYQDCFFHVRFIYERALLINNSVFYPEYKRYEDQIFLVKAMLAAGGFYALNLDMYDYRIVMSGHKLSSASLSDSIKGLIEILKLANSSELEELYELVLENYKKYYQVYLYYYSCFIKDKALVETRKALEIYLKQNASDRYLIDDETFFIKWNSVFNEKKKIDDILFDERKLIIYGDGKWSRVLQKYISKCFQGKSFDVVTTTGDNNTKIIDLFLNEAEKCVVIIAVSEIYSAEIERYINSKGRFSTYVLNVKAIDFNVWLQIGNSREE